MPDIVDVALPSSISLGSIIVLTGFGISLLAAMWKLRVWFDKIKKDTKAEVERSSGLIKTDIIRDNSHVKEILTMKINEVHKCIRDMEIKLDDTKKLTAETVNDAKKSIINLKNEVDEMNKNLNKNMLIATEERAKLRGLEKELDMVEKRLEKVETG